MGLLVGLPLKLLHIVFILVRFAWPLLIGLVIYTVLKKLRKRAGQTGSRQSSDFDGPVVEVDYEVVDDKEE